MTLTVKDLRELPITKNFVLVAGESGMDKAIRKVNILDFEYVDAAEEPTEPDGLFNPDSLVLTSLLYAKDDPRKILPGLKQLLLDGVSALAVKTVYFNELPQEVYEYAERRMLPIFFFQDTDFENVIIDIMRAVEERSRFESLERDVEGLFQPENTAEDRYRIIKRLFYNLSPPYLCCYFAPQTSHPQPNYEQHILRLRSRNAPGRFYLPYRSGTLVLTEEERRETLAMDMGINENECRCGFSSVYRIFEHIPFALQESVYAAEFAKRNDLASANFEEMGIWQLILPNRDNYWLNMYCHSVIQKLKNFESDSSCELYRTIEIYVKNEFDSEKTAREISLHKNSVRYRVTKAREILGLEDDPVQFRQAIYFAVMFSSLFSCEAK